MAEPSARDWTFRDAGNLPLAIRALNALGRLRPGSTRLDPDAIVAQAVANSGSDDFDGDEWREGLEVLCEASNREAHNTAFAVAAQRRMHQGVLERRLRLVDWAKRHPEVRQERIEAPIVVLGMPRTGTTLLSYLLDLDPVSRSLKSWEAGTLVPPPTLAGYETDARIAAAARADEQMTRLIPPAPAMHPLGPTLPTECVPLMMMDFRSLGFETQVFAPTYGRWLEDCDMRSAYRIHQLALQTLQSTIPTTRWALKTPNHLWAIGALLERYPDARIVWTHRDPTRVIPSVASLNTSFHRTWSSAADPVAIGRHWAEKLLFAVERGMAHDDTADRGWCHHLQYEDLMRDPVEAVRGIYASFGEALSPLHERRITLWIRNRPQDTYGRHRYDMADFGFTTDGLDEMFKTYRERFDVPTETRD